ncbi:MAG: hypothetical protein KDJ45_10650 [Hyphomicrobiaceae bacterium]|nr:hypothetical protein [Hyphomicrobiaceae bacterium]
MPTSSENALAAIAGAFALVSPTRQAEAGKLRILVHDFKHHHFHHHNQWRGDHYNGCRYSYKKWKWTG